jgi:hypothetical protein
VQLDINRPAERYYKIYVQKQGVYMFVLHLTTIFVGAGQVETERNLSLLCSSEVDSANYDLCYQ